MSTLTSTVLNLADWAKRVAPDGSIDSVVEILNQKNGIIEDIPWKEGNLPTGERVTIRTGLPTVAWRLINGATTPSKSTTAQATVNAGMLEAWSEIDKDLVELNGNSAAFILSESKAFVEAMRQEFAQTAFYGNTGTYPEEFLGFDVQFNSTSATSGENVILGGGAGSDNMSIWLVGWGENTVYGVFPKGSKAGLVQENLGLQTVTGSAGIGGTRMRAYQQHYQWKCGLVVKDWEYVARVCNIDNSDLIANSGSESDLLFYMSKAYHRIPDMSTCKPVWYMNRTAFEFLDIQARSEVKGGGGLNYSNVGGEVIRSFRGIPIKVVDQLTIAESTKS
jgi:hypothetical protein